MKKIRKMHTATKNKVGVKGIGKFEKKLLKNLLLKKGLVSKHTVASVSGHVQ
jgi:hypothetical protein